MSGRANVSSSACLLITGADRFWWQGTVGLAVPMTCCTAFTALRAVYLQRAASS